MQFPKNYQVLLVSHYTETAGLVHKFQQYFEKKKIHPTMLLHPLFPGSALPSLVRVKEQEITYKVHSVLQYPLEMFFSLGLLQKIKFGRSSTDLAVCFDPLSFVHTYFLRIFFKIDKIIYYNLDYSKSRFANPLANFIYQRVNVFAFQRSDYFFSATEQFMIDLDPEQKLQHRSFFLKHVVDTSAVKLRQKKESQTFVYAGSFGETTNFTSLLKALQKLSQEKYTFSFDLYGGGKHLEEVVQAVKRLKLKNNVHFKGPVSNLELVNTILPKYSFGVCPYKIKGEPGAPDHMFYGNELTSKLIEYLAAGLPILSTPLLDAFEVIEKEKIGFLVQSSQDWYLVIKKLLHQPKILISYQQKALKYSSNYDMEKVLDPLFSHIVSERRV